MKTLYIAICLSVLIGLAAWLLGMPVDTVESLAVIGAFVIAVALLIRPAGGK